MAYTRTHWVNNLTQLNAKNMNNIEDGIEENIEHISQSDTKITSLNSRVTALEATRITYSDPNNDGNIVLTSTGVCKRFLMQ